MSPMSLTKSQLKSIELLQSGMAQKDVAQELGVTPKTLQRWAKIPEYLDSLNGVVSVPTTKAPEQTTKIVKQEPKNEIFETFVLVDREKLRQQQYEKLQTAQNAIMDDVEGGDLRAITTFVKLSESIRLLYGLNVKHDILDALEVLVKAKILPYAYLEKYKDFSSDHQRKIKNLGNEPPRKVIPLQTFNTIEEEINYYLSLTDDAI